MTDSEKEKKKKKKKQQQDWLEKEIFLFMQHNIEQAAKAALDEVFKDFM